MAKRSNDKTARKAAAPFPIHAGMGERALAYCLIKNQECKTPWIGGDDKYGKMRWTAVDAIVDCRAHGMRERDVIAHARRFVRDWFDSGIQPKPIGNPAVRVLAHSDAYPLDGKAQFVGILTGAGFARAEAERTIAEAERDGLIHTRRGRFGIEYRLTYEPRTREVCELADRVAGLMPKYPGGVPFRLLQHVAGRILGHGVDSGAALIERALNAGVLRSETRGTEWNRERFIFTNTKAKGK